MSIKNVLLVSYTCPPNMTIGALRIIKMLKYLPQFGYQPYWLGGVPGENSNPYIFVPKYFDPLQFAKKSGDILNKHLNKESVSVSSRISNSLENHSLSRGLLPLSEVRTPDKYMFWIPPAIKFGRQLLDRKKFDIIYSSSGPASSAIVASILQRRSNIPWVAEFRDLWSENYFDIRKEPINTIDSYLGDWTLKNCSAFVTVSEPLREKLIKRHGKRAYVVYNGYDEDDYPINPDLTDKFTITYTGRIYPGKQDPSFLFQAIAELDQANIITPDDLQIRFYSPEYTNKEIQPFINKYKIDRYVYFGGLVPYKESLLRQMESWLLLIFEWNDPAEKGNLTGKFFEYLGAKRPILSVGYKGSSIEEKLKETEAGIFLGNPEDIKAFLLSCIDMYKKGEGKLGFSIKSEKVAVYSRKNAAEQISHIFSSLL